ncbi:MAG TPA: ABC transporter ATP-binding protein/permease [Sphingorhabdus sp.]|nr:ABC transporter ATP-binding protein/permease [Sphingorhabdus sp.]
MAAQPENGKEKEPAKAEASFATLKRFLPYLWPKDMPALRIRIVIAMLLVLVSKGVQLSMGFVYGAAIDRMQPGLEAGVWIAIGLVVAYTGARFGGVLFDNLRNTVFERVGQDATRRLAENTFAHLHRLSMRFHMNRRTGAVTKVIERGTKSIDVMLYFMLFNIAPTAIELIAVLVIFWFKFGLALVVATIVMVVTYILFTQRVTDWRNKLREEMNELDTATVARSVDSLLNYETVKYFNAEDRETNYYATVARRYADAAVKSENSLAWLNIGQSFITNLMMAGAMGFSVWGWAQGRFSTGDVVLVNTLLMQLFRPLDMLGMVYRTIRQGLIDMAAMFDLVDTPPEIVDKPGATALRVSGGELAFEDVTFGYDPERQILNGLSLRIPPGKTLAVVGPSGAGKSTIARLLYRFYDVTGGRITIDGQDLRDVTQSSLRAHIGIVPQDTVLFNDSIGYNIGYGREGASQAEIEDAARAAQIHNFIAAQPKQYETQVGERGLKLSGGEKQRVAIARTLLKNPPILILDEATSALDSRTEAELLAKDGHYAEMWARQQAEKEEEAVAAE